MAKAKMNTKVRLTMSRAQAEALYCLLHCTDETILDDVYHALGDLDGLSVVSYSIRHSNPSASLICSLGGSIERELHSITITKNPEENK